MIGNSTNDQFFVNSVNDKVTENFVGGADTVMTTLNSYTLGANLEVLKFIGTGAFTGTGTGNNLKDSITGGTGVNTLTAGTGGSVLIGGIANDVLTGGTGNDTMTGGAGNDTFKFVAANFGVDMIQDFTAHAGATIHDLIDLSGFVKAAAFTTSVKITQFNTTDALVTVNGGGATGGTIRLVGVLSSAINVTDFHLG
jgi:Ca2+-binding RTX toxin-like protein